MSKLLIIGAGGHGKVVADIASTLGTWTSISFLDDRDELKEVIGFPVIGKLKDYVLYKERYHYAFVGIGDYRIRLDWLQKLIDEGFSIPTIIHPFSSISKNSCIGQGTVVMAGVVVNACVRVGEGCILNTCSSLDHDCVVEDGVHISPGVHVSGSVRIGKGSWICVGSCIANDIRIGSDVIIAAGSAVVKNVPDSVMAAGVPATIKKRLGVE